MKKAVPSLLTGGAVLLALAGCSGTASVGSIGDLHNAAVKAGISCDNPENDSRSLGKAEDCGSTTLTYFADNKKRDAQIKITKIADQAMGMSAVNRVLIGDHFMVEGSDSTLENAKKVLGGKVVDIDS